MGDPTHELTKQWLMCTPETLDVVVRARLRSEQPQALSVALVQKLCDFPPESRVRLESFERMLRKLPAVDQSLFVAAVAQVQSACRAVFVLWYLYRFLNRRNAAQAIANGLPLLINLDRAVQSGHSCEHCEGYTRDELVSPALSDIADFVLHSNEMPTRLRQLVSSESVYWRGVGYRTVLLLSDVSWHTCRLATREEISARKLKKLQIETRSLMSTMKFDLDVLKVFPFLNDEISSL